MSYAVTLSALTCLVYNELVQHMQVITSAHVLLMGPLSQGTPQQDMSRAFVSFNGCEDAFHLFLSRFVNAPSCHDDTRGDREIQAAGYESQTSSPVMLPCF